MFVSLFSYRGQCALKLLKTSTCADVQRTEDQEYEIPAATSCATRTACRAVPPTGSTVGHRVRVQCIAETARASRTTANCVTSVFPPPVGACASTGAANERAFATPSLEISDSVTAVTEQ